MTVDDMVGMIGLLPTPATPDAEHWEAVQTINVSETEKMVAGVVAGGIEILMTTATFGEIATLTWDELRIFADCVIRTAAPRPVFIGVTTLNTRDTIARARSLVALGAAGIFAGRPLWTRLNDDQIVAYYRDLAAALPGVPIVVYDNPRAFRGTISLDVYRALATIPEIIAVRQVGGPDTDAAIEALGDRIRFLPNEKFWYPAAMHFPDRARACWSGNVACGPAPMAALARAVLARDWSAAEAIHNDLEWAGETMYPAGALDASFSDYSIQLCHIRMRAAGYIDPGPSRPPYIGVPAQYVAGAEEVGRRFRQLHERYRGVSQ
jgi:4-(2-carboxyphenyl)-2-oxobut-3-enoate aldolase